MALDPAQLAAVAAVVRTGSFDKAAARLFVTTSAISQRVRHLEERLGTVLIQRGQPCTATAAGLRLCRHAEEVGLLEDRLNRDLGGLLPSAGWPMVRIAVNSDSLATWFLRALAPVEGLLFDLALDHEAHSADWLRRGEVSAAVTAQASPVQGCDCRPLGSLRYLATASPAYMARWFAQGVTAAALGRAPSLRFDAKDRMQERWMAACFGQAGPIPAHWLPSPDGFVAAALLGLGWGLNPEILVRPHLEAGRLVALDPEPFDVPLHWQWNRAVAPALEPLSRAVIAAARGLLA